MGRPLPHCAVRPAFGVLKLKSFKKYMNEVWRKCFNYFNLYQTNKRTFQKNQIKIHIPAVFAASHPQLPPTAHIPQRGITTSPFHSHIKDLVVTQRIIPHIPSLFSSSYTSSFCFSTPFRNSLFIRTRCHDGFYLVLANAPLLGEGGTSQTYHSYRAPKTTICHQTRRYRIP